MHYGGTSFQTTCIIMTDLAELFRKPESRTHLQYEALRAHFLEGLEAGTVAERFGYGLGSFRNLRARLRGNPDLSPFFAERGPGPRANPEEPLRLRRDRRILELRRTAALSVGEIGRKLVGEGIPAGTTTVRRVLRGNGIGKLPRRSPGEREAALRPAAAPVADVRELDLSPRRLRTGFGGLFPFVPDLVRLDLDPGFHTIP